MSRRKPIRQQINEGDPQKRGVRTLRECLQSEPKAAHGLPACPKHLKGRARAAWAILKEELEAMNLDCRPDSLALEGACSSYAIAADAEEILAREGLQREVPVFHRGQQIGTETRNHPALRIRNAAWGKFLAFATQFGLTPQARQSLAVERPDDGAAELAEILSRPRKPRTPTPEDAQKEKVQ
jgi:P27 family predicted phage terminase small subunit